MHRLLLRVIACCLPALPSLAQGPLDSLLNSFGASFTSQPSHNGLSIGVYADGKTYYFNYGTVKRGTPITPTDSTIYELGSVTKTFTAYLLAQAVTEGKLRLQDDVRKYLDGTYPNLAYYGHPITIENLANHTAGLPKFLPRLDPTQTPDQILAMYPDISGTQLLSELLRFIPDTLPGTRFIYSNADAQLIGLILEKINARPYAELLHRYITGPLGMTDTWLTVPEKDTGRIALGYNAKGEIMPKLRFWRSLPAAGYIKSTTEDMVKYMQFYLDEKNAVVELSHRVTFHNTGEHDADIALFWFVKEQPGGYRELLHGGGSFGTTSLCLLVPQHRIGVICLANDATPGTEHTLTLLSEAIAKMLITSTSL
jgi:D-alanyl-D-alanine-carboxypeptidase/D-alanyl-D-alanine-endopeptidase